MLANINTGRIFTLSNNNKKQNDMTTTVNFYEGSYQFYTVNTNLNVDTDYIEMKLAKQYEYRPTDETLWATISQNGQELSRFKFEYGLGLVKL